MNLGDISNIYKENLESFFSNEKVIELIYKEQFGSENYEKNKEEYHKKFNQIMDNTVFMPYITLNDLDDLLLNTQKSIFGLYLKTEAGKAKKEKLEQKINSNKTDIIKEQSSSMLDDLKLLFPDLTEEQYSNIFQYCSNVNSIELNDLEQLLPDLAEDHNQYFKLLDHSSDTNSIELYDLKQLLPDLTENQYSQILNHCSDKLTKSIIDESLKNKNRFFSKFRKSDAKKNVEKIVEDHLKNILETRERIYSEEQLLYTSKYMESNFGKELNLSKRLNAEKKDIIKKYSSFMLDDLKPLFPDLTEDEYSKILKKCSNKSFDENADFIKNALFKDKNSLFKKSKVETIIEKYQEITDEKVLMETSSFYKHLADVPEGKYYTDILESISSEGQSVTQSIGKNTDKNIRYIFLPVFKYNSKEDYLKNALHEVMHISKEQLSNKHYTSGFLERDLSRNPNASTLAIKYNVFTNLLQTLKWSRIAKKIRFTKPFIKMV